MRPGDTILLSLALLNAPAIAAEGSSIVSARPFGRIFFRPELGLNMHDFDWNARDTDFIFTLRTNTGIDVELPRDIHVVTDLQSYGTYALNAGPLDPSIKLYQGYIDFLDMGDTPLNLRVGRFEEEPYGTGMVISNDRFYDGFSLEGVRLRYDTERVKIDLMWSQLYAFDTTGGEDAAFWRNPVLFGTDGAVRLLPALSVESYVWWMVARPFMGWKTQTVTLGARLYGRSGGPVPIDYSVEGNWQTGTGKGLADERDRATISAYAVEPRVGAAFGPVHLGLEYYRASGDDDISDGEVKSYNTMWQNPHGRFGNLDRYTGSNIQAGILAAEIRLAPGDLPSRLGGDAFTLSVLEPGDPNASVFQDGTVPDADASRALGSGGDLWLAVPVTREVRWRIDFAAMQPGALVKEAAGTADLQFRGYTMIEAEF